MKLLTYRNHKPVKAKLNSIVCLVTFALAIGFLAARSIASHNDISFNVYAEAPTKIISPLAPTPTNMPIPTPTVSQRDIILSEVKEVFGKDAAKAEKILNCENHALNPKALNDNTKWGGRGKDWGVFQINDSWQGVSNVSFLTDYHINIRMAYHIFKSWGNFNAWACAKKVGLYEH